MNIFKMTAFLFLAVILGVCASQIYAKTFTVSSAIPSPYGIYDRLKLVPRDPLAHDPDCNDPNDIGMLYFDNGSGEKFAGIYVCVPVSEDAFDWRTFPLSRPIIRQTQ